MPDCQNANKHLLWLNLFPQIDRIHDMAAHKQQYTHCEIEFVTYV